MINFIVETILLDMSYNALGKIIHTNKQDTFCSNYEPKEPITKINGEDYMSDVIDSLSYYPPDTRYEGKGGEYPQSMLVITFVKENTTGRVKNVEGKEPTIYFGVPYQAFRDFLSSKSKGQFWYRNFANAYPNGELKEIQDFWKNLYEEGKVYDCIFNYYNRQLQKIRDRVVSLSSQKLMERRAIKYFLSKLDDYFGLGLSKETKIMIARNILNPKLTRADDWRQIIIGQLDNKYKRIQIARQSAKKDVKINLFFGENSKYARTVLKDGSYGKGLSESGRKAYRISAKQIDSQFDAQLLRIKQAKSFVLKTRNPFLNVNNFSQSRMKYQIDKQFTIKVRKSLQKAQGKKLGEMAVVQTKGVRSVARKGKAVKKSVGKIIRKLPK